MIDPLKLVCLTRLRTKRDILPRMLDSSDLIHCTPSGTVPRPLYGDQPLTDRDQCDEGRYFQDNCISVQNSYCTGSSCHYPLFLGLRVGLVARTHDRHLVDVSLRRPTYRGRTSGYDCDRHLTERTILGVETSFVREEDSSTGRDRSLVFRRGSAGQGGRDSGSSGSSRTSITTILRHQGTKRLGTSYSLFLEQFSTKIYLGADETCPRTPLKTYFIPTDGV